MDKSIVIFEPQSQNTASSFSTMFDVMFDLIRGYYSDSSPLNEAAFKANTFSSGFNIAPGLDFNADDVNWETGSGLVRTLPKSRSKSFTIGQAGSALAHWFFLGLDSVLGDSCIIDRQALAVIIALSKSLLELKPINKRQGLLAGLPTKVSAEVSLLPNLEKELGGHSELHSSGIAKEILELNTVYQNANEELDQEVSNLVKLKQDNLSSRLSAIGALDRELSTKINQIVSDLNEFSSANKESIKQGFVVNSSELKSRISDVVSTWVRINSEATDLLLSFNSERAKVESFITQETSSKITENLANLAKGAQNQVQINNLTEGLRDFVTSSNKLKDDLQQLNLWIEGAKINVDVSTLLTTICEGLKETSSSRNKILATLTASKSVKAIADLGQLLT